MPGEVHGNPELRDNVDVGLGFAPSREPPCRGAVQ